jgi:hypothetical protein
MKEESQAEQLLKEMEKLEPDSSEFSAKLAKLRREVERHAEAEETKEFPRVAQKESPDRLRQMGRAYEAAKRASMTATSPARNTPRKAQSNEETAARRHLEQVLVAVSSLPRHPYRPVPRQALGCRALVHQSTKMRRPVTMLGVRRTRTDRYPASPGLDLGRLAFPSLGTARPRSRTLHPSRSASSM